MGQIDQNTNTKLDAKKEQEQKKANESKRQREALIFLARAGARAHVPISKVAQKLVRYRWLCRM